MRKRKSLNIRDNYSMRDSLLLSLKETKIKLNDLKAEKIIIQNNFTEQGDLLIKEIETLTGYCELSKLKIEEYMKIIDINSCEKEELNKATAEIESLKRMLDKTQQISSENNIYNQNLIWETEQTINLHLKTFNEQKK
jgi:hypothetical protein